jgi:lysozyme family protein
VIENRQVWLDVLFGKAVEGQWQPPRPGESEDTMHGITLETLQRWRAPAMVTIKDLEQLTVQESRAIASAGFWNKVQADKLPGGIDVLVAVLAFRSWPQHAVQALQRALGFVGTDVDGYVGPKTLTAVQLAEPVALINDYCDRRLAFLRSLDNWAENAIAWKAGIEAIRNLALHLAPAKSPTAIAEAARAKTNTVARLSIGGVVVSFVQPIIEAVPAAKSAFEAVTGLADPYEVVLPGIGLALGGLAIVGIIYTKARASRLSKAAVASGAVEVAVA